MDFTENTIRTGQSVVGDYRLDYSITYNKDKLMKIEAQVKQVSASAPSYAGNILYVESTKKYSCSCPEHQLKYAPLYWQILRKQLPN